MTETDADALAPSELRAADHRAIGGEAALARHAPVAAGALARLVAIRPADLPAEAVATLRAASAAATRLAALGGATLPRGADAALVDYAEQFSADVSSVDDALRSAFAGACGPALFGAVQMTYVADFAPRVHAALDALFGPSAWASPGAVAVEDPWPAVDAFIREVARLGALDPVTTELVRLRGARQHECRLCKSRRSRSAVAGGADADAFEAVDHHADSDLPDRVKAALALTDAIIWEPAAIGPEVAAGVRAHFGPAEAVEIVLDVARNATNKIAVALAADAPVVAEGVEWFDVDDDGNVSYGLEAPA